jgi:Domain of unknown function (DUF4331)
MSNHFSADNLKFPGDDRRLDLTDVYVFRSADDADKTMLIIDSNPTSAPPPIPPPTTGPEFHPDAVYRINVDTDGDLQADIAFTFTFSAFENGSQTGSAWYATGAQARQPEPAGEQLADSLPVSFGGTARPVQAGPVRMSAGLRSDPFFADVEGALHGFQWTGHDDFAGNNVGSIALEVPSDMLGAGPVIGVWATISLRRDGTLVQMDRGETRPSTRSSTPTARKTSTTPGSRPTTSPTTSGRGPKSWRTAATRPRKPRRQLCRYCPTSSATTAPSPPPTPTAVASPTTCSACALPG